MHNPSGYAQHDNNNISDTPFFRAGVAITARTQGRAFGPESQRRAIKTYADREGLEIVAEHAEDISGTLPLDDRPGLQPALASVYAQGASGLLVAERTPLARDEFAAHDAKRTFAAAGARVLYADGSNGDDDAALLLDGVGHAVAAYERRRIVARLRAGREVKASHHPGSRSQGGKLPHGYRRGKGGMVEIDPEEAKRQRRSVAPSSWCVTASPSARLPR